MRMRKVCLVVGISLTVCGCNVQPLVQLALLPVIPPQAIAAAPVNQVTTPGVGVILDGSASGMLVGGTVFLTATQSDMTFLWEITAAVDPGNGLTIAIPADATVVPANGSSPTFTATTIADYNIQLTVTSGKYTGTGITGVRVIPP
jgi:large exoprotein involved in heme utilization and adhesion